MTDASSKPDFSATPIRQDEPLRLLFQHFYPDSECSRIGDFLFEPSGMEPPCWNGVRAAAAVLWQKLQHDAETDMDAQVSVWIAKDQLSAWCLLFPPLGQGADITASALRKALSQERVTAGLQEDVLDALVAEKSYFRLARVAVGLAALHGEDGQVVDLALNGHTGGCVEDEEGRIDFKELDWIVNVTEGQKLCQVIPATRGRDGFTVLGRMLKARNGRPATYASGHNTAFTDDGAFVVASVDGQLVIQSGRYVVNEVLTIPGNVDYSTGNIHAKGSVVVKGDVYPGFQIDAQKDIIVYGSVDAGTLIAGGDIHVRGGVLASNEGQLRAEGDIRCKFMEYATAIAGGNAYFETLIHSRVSCEGDLFVTSGRGVVMGGELKAMGSISITTAGNRASCATPLHVDPTETFLTRKRETVLKLHTEAEGIRRLMEAIRKLKALPEPPAEQLQQLEASLPISRIRLQRLEKEVEDMERREEACLSGHVSIRKSYPNVTVRVGKTSLLLSEESGPTKYFLKEEGEIGRIPIRV